MCFLDRCQYMYPLLPAEPIGHSPVRRVECNGVHLDEDTVTLQFWLRDILNLGFAG
jgi:hypothetical protein